MPSDDVLVREANPSDHEQVRHVVESAFGGVAEANLIARLREDGLGIREFIVVRNSEVLGMVMFSRLDLTVDDRAVVAAALAPVAVAPLEQRKGLGRVLIAEGLRALAGDGIEAVIVLGHPSYYPQFGFSRHLTRHLESVYQSDAFMALELVPGVLAGSAGTVRYPVAFSLAE